MKSSLRNLTTDDVVQAVHTALRDANRASSGYVERRGSILDVNVRAEENTLARVLVDELEKKLTEKRAD